MIIKIDDCHGNIEIEEFLEPTSGGYEIRQGENKIILSEYLAEELGRSLQFLLHRYKLCNSDLSGK